MATGIVSSAFGMIGLVAVSVVLAVIAVLGLVVLAVLLGWRLIRFRALVLRDADDPRIAFGFFTVVAALNVVGLRLHDPESPGVTITLAVISLPLWLLCSYGIPGTLMLRAHNAPVASTADGSWFLWVVGTQSLAAAGAAVGADMRWSVLAAISVGFWSVGVLLYLMLATMVTLRLLTVPTAPMNLKPSYWIYMGATAITVFAGSRILVMPEQLPIVAVVEPVVSGLTFMLWAFGVWWIPLLVIFGFWRHVTHHEPLRYETGHWSIVFPLGMYSVASMHFGAEAGLPLVLWLGVGGTWVAGAAWVIVAVSMVVSFFRARTPIT